MMTCFKPKKDKIHDTSEYSRQNHFGLIIIWVISRYSHVFEHAELIELY